MLSTTFCPYFHVVFTVPEQIADIALQNKRTVYGILFRATAETLQTIAADPQHLGAALGFFAVLHTWGQNLLHHPHRHCVIPGGGLSADPTRWISCRPGFFLPVGVLSRLFRRLFLKYLENAFDSGELQFFGSLEKLRDNDELRSFIAPLKQTEWVVYAKPPFAAPRQVLDYVGRYTHRVAISNNRLLPIEDGRVTFQWKDYRDKDRPKKMTLPAQEFIRRFLIHVLPDRFQRIRYYGFLSNPHRGEKLALCRQLLGMPALNPEPRPGDQPSDYDFVILYERLTGSSLRQCPICHHGRMIVVETLAPALPQFIDNHDDFSAFWTATNAQPQSEPWPTCGSIAPRCLHRILQMHHSRRFFTRTALPTASYTANIAVPRALTHPKLPTSQHPSAIQNTFAIQQP